MVEVSINYEIIKMDNIKGFLFENGHHEKCWRITSYILAQYEIKNLSHPNSEYWCPFENQFQEFFNGHFIKELIEIASFTRALLDCEDIKIPNQINGIDDFVGSLKYDNKAEVGLSFRESCNKIIHAKEFSIKYESKKTHPLDNGKNGYVVKGEERIYNNPIVKLSGTKNKINWVIELDFLRFIDFAMIATVISN